MKVLICGDRHWSDRGAICSWLCELKNRGYDTVIEGEQRGADIIAREEADNMGITIKKFPAKWNRYGIAAGPIRNRQMLDEKPDLVLAFHNDIVHSKGTADTIKEAQKRGIQVIIIRANNEIEKQLL